MNDLISREELIKEVCGKCDGACDCCCEENCIRCKRPNMRCDFRKALDEAPTVDAVEVVRCKECKNISPSVTPMRETLWCREFRAYMPCDGFCSYAERRATNEVD